MTAKNTHSELIEKLAEGISCLAPSEEWLHYLDKGRLVYIDGRLVARRWQAIDCCTRRIAEIIVNQLQELSRKSAPSALAA
jgi:single-stranded DNA-binding protein